MTHRAVLTLRFTSAQQAQRLAASLGPDDDGFLRMRVEGATLVAEAAGDSPMGLLRTLDEVLAALGAAEKADKLARS